MATSETAIANGALQRLGARRIESLTQNHPNARTMAAAFARTRDALLRRYDWNFAIARDSIAADGDGPTWGSWNRYALPADFIRLIRDDESGGAVDWKIEGQYILSADAAPIEIRYISRVEDPNAFDALFIEALECKLALTCCEEVTQSTAKMQGLTEAYKDAIFEAKRAGAIEKPAQEFPEDSWLTARY